MPPTANCHPPWRFIETRSDCKEKTVPDPTTHIIRPKLHHWGMRTAKFQEMVDWYSTVVGFETVLSSDSPAQVAFVTNDEQHHRGGFFSPPGVTDNPGRGTMPGVNHLAWEYDTLDDLLATWSRLDEQGIRAVLTTDHGPSFSFYYKDPENNTVELTCLAYDDLAKVKERLRSPENIRNPMGQPVTPEQLIAAREQGSSLAEIHERALAGDYVPEGPAPRPALIL
jgi:catechol 2,3-dioxygenase